MKILLIRNDNIGDLICTTPAIEALRKAYPSAQIDIVVNSLNAPVVQNNPFLNRVFIYTKPKHVRKFSQKIGAFFKKAKICLKIALSGYDVAVIFRSSYSSSASLFAKISRAKTIIGVGKKGFINEKVEFENEHEVMFCFKLLAPLGVKFSGEKTLFMAQNPRDDFRDFVFFHISSRVRENALSEDKILQIIEFLKSKFKRVLITAENSEFGDRISQISGAQYLKTANFSELADFLSTARALITLDGGVAHLGPALGIKTIAIFGKTAQNRWAPTYARAKCVVLQDESFLAENVKNEEIFNAIKKEFS